MKNPFQSARLTYRAIESADTDLILRLVSDPVGLANASGSLLRPLSQEYAEKMYTKPSDALLGVHICLPSSSSDSSAGETGVGADKPIGRLFLSKSAPAEQHHRKSLISIRIEAQYQGKGYGGEAIRWALNWAFEMAGLHRVGLTVFEWNVSARGLYEKLGFVAEGREREALWFDGRWWDVLYYGILDFEWQEKAQVARLIV